MSFPPQNYFMYLLSTCFFHNKYSTNQIERSKKNMKASMTNSKNGLAKHNDRTFEKDKNDRHIDESKSCLNVYSNIYGDTSLTFDQAEAKFYKENYSKWIDYQNEKYKKIGNKKMHKSVNTVLKNRQFCPEETILQIGNKDDTIDLDVFKSCVNDFIKDMEQYSSNCHILDVAVHADEASLHAHIRRVWDYTDVHGNKRISQTKALEQLGFNPVQYQNRWNNNKVVFDSLMRSKWYDICEAHGFMIEREPMHIEKAIDKQDYIMQKQEHMLSVNSEILAKQKEIMKNDVEHMKEEKNQLIHEIAGYQEECKKLADDISNSKIEKDEYKNQAEQYKNEIEQYRNEIERLHEEIEKEEKEYEKKHNERQAKKVIEAAHVVNLLAGEEKELGN